MGRYARLMEVERRVRATNEYAAWVRRNKAGDCLLCDSAEKLEHHHIVELYHVMLGLWKLYGDWDAVFTHAVAMHQDDVCEGATLCGRCHGKTHPGKAAAKGLDPTKLQVELWCAVPRILPPFSQGTKSRSSGTMGLIAFQTLLGVGWHVMGGHMDDRVLVVDRRKLARLTGRRPGTSFNRRLDEAVQDLEAVGLISGAARDGNKLELIMGRPYVDGLGNPWFFPLAEVATGRMGVLALRWFLRLQNKRSRYSIGYGKLAGHLGLATTTPAFVGRCVTQCCSDIRWATVRLDDRGVFRFRLSRRGAVPVHTMRRVLFDGVEGQ